MGVVKKRVGLLIAVFAMVCSMGVVGVSAIEQPLNPDGTVNPNFAQQYTDEQKEGGLGGMVEKDKTAYDRAHDFQKYTNAGMPTAETNAAAAEILGPFTGLVQMAISVIILGLIIVIGLMTAVDLVYLLIPLFRPLLAPQQNVAGGGMSGENAAVGSRFQIVSDDAMQALMSGGNNVATAGYQGNGASNMRRGSFGGHGGYGAYGGGASAGAYGQGANNANQNKSRKHVLSAYVRSRVVTLVMLGIAIMILFGSFLMDFGFSLGAFVLSLLTQIINFLGL